MKTIYLYVLDTLADWEIGHLTSEVQSKRFFKKDAEKVAIKTVSHSKAPIHTMGGITIVPDAIVSDIVAAKENLLLLPGADTWDDPRHDGILDKAKEFLSLGGTVGAICGATAALANKGMLDSTPHTSNGPGFLEMVSPEYKGQEFYVDRSSVSVNNLITAGSTNSLSWTKDIIESLDVFQPDTLEAWYQYFDTGDANHFYELMNTLPAAMD
ncbi:hypothetical protein IGI66_000572 [Enterococcus sp. AZ048]|uniref:DJ-1/PfpI family protein n=1 Tax=Enterococcus sp. AZ048 TaxID=2774658 RepID=UPI003F1FA396